MILLDTCTLLWLVADQKRLSSEAKLTLSHNLGTVFVSSISAFEIGIKSQKKLLILPQPPMVWFARCLELHGLTEIPVNYRIAITATRLPPHHKDPADRILIATAMEHDLALLSPDLLLKSYKDVETRW